MTAIMAYQTLKRYSLRLLFLVAISVLAPISASSQEASNHVKQQTSTHHNIVKSSVKTGAANTTSAALALHSTLVPSVPRVGGTRGVLVETLNNETVMEQASDVAFNPASGVKLALALTALRSFGPDHRFNTAVWMNGTLDKTTGTITGDLVISGRDPSFHYEHAVMLALELNRLGVRIVTGDLIVAPRFTMDFEWSAQRSGDHLYDTLDATRRSASATRAWIDQRTAVGDTASLQNVPSVAVMGAVYVDSAPAGSKMLLTHKSSRLTDVLKALLCYSNNFMAELIGESLGGPEGVRHMMISKFGINPSEISLSSTSGLRTNRMTPRAMMKIFRALRAELAKYKLSVADILPVAGVDPGTLEKRYVVDTSRGSVIAKTGTLIRTDGGASSLTGQMRTASGETLLFVIFNQSGSVIRFREYQDALVTQIQCTLGGPAPFKYQPQPLMIRLADSEIDTSRPGREDEYEPGTK